MQPDDGPTGVSWYPAHMRPIPFPDSEARAAQATCERIAALLDDHLGARPGIVDGARDGWEGAFRREFDDTWGTQEGRLSGLAEDLRRLAGRIAAAAGNAATLNEQRASLRAEYARQQAGEAAGLH